MSRRPSSRDVLFDGRWQRVDSTGIDDSGRFVLPVTPYAVPQIVTTPGTCRVRVRGLSTDAVSNTVTLTRAR